LPLFSCSSQYFPYFSVSYIINLYFDYTFESNESTNSATTNKNGFWFLPTASATLGSFVGSVMLVGDEVGSFRKILAPAIGASFGVLGTLLALGKLKKKSSVPPTDSPQA
jgi:hypothetical protein